MAEITYPATIKTDFEKLKCVYSLVEQMRLEHNSVAEDFRGRLVLESAPTNPEEYKKKQEQGFIPTWVPEGFMVSDTLNNIVLKGKFKTYAQISKDKLKKLLAEQNELKENIRWAKYTPVEWKAVGHLPEQTQDAVYHALFGDKEVEKVKPTKATSPLLDELKALDLDSLPETLGIDPVEDFTSASWKYGVPQSDPDSELTVIASKVTVTTMARSEDAFFYSDKDSGHFNGNFEHLLEGFVDSGSSNSAGVIIWALSDSTDSYLDIVGASGDLIGLQIGAGGGDLSGKCVTYLREVDGGTEYYDFSALPLEDVLHFFEVERDEDIAAYGTAYVYICTGEHWDDGGTQIDTLTLALHTSKKDFQNIYSIMGKTSPTGLDYVTCYMQNLDLQEGGAETQTISSAGNIASAEAFGTLQVNLKAEPSGIESGEALGSPQANLRAEPSGIASAEALGSPQANLNLSVVAIASGEAFGTTALKIYLLPSAIESGEAFGTAKIGDVLGPTGIESGEAFGDVDIDFELLMTGIESAEAFGTSALKIYIISAGIASGEAFGTALLGSILSLAGIVSEEAFGDIDIQFRLLMTGIESEEAFGDTIVSTGGQTLLPEGISSSEALGSPALELTITPSGIASAEAFGSVFLQLIRGITTALKLPGRSVTLSLPGRSKTIKIPGRSTNVKTYTE